jgi:hypothetical protein
MKKGQIAQVKLDNLTYTGNEAAYPFETFVTNLTACYQDSKD